MKFSQSSFQIHTYFLDFMICTISESDFANHIVILYFVSANPSNNDTNSKKNTEKSFSANKYRTEHYFIYEPARSYVRSKRVVIKLTASAVITNRARDFFNYDQSMERGDRERQILSRITTYMRPNQIDAVLIERNNRVHPRVIDVCTTTCAAPPCRRLHNISSVYFG